MGSNVANLKAKVTSQAKTIESLEATIADKLREIEAIRKQAEDTGAQLGKNLFELMNKIEKLDEQNDILIHVLGKTAR